ncbi:efflux transporter outer membrane subunit [Flavobacteriaceae bacterium Ap0902]|nr:efflux transporter outer membrane subunit [Flavobacteriaceae bacterium Ap0902]
MKMKSNWIKYSFIIGIILTFQSCLAVKEYTRSEKIEDDIYYRTDMLPKDSTSMADFSYTAIFKDELLQQYIEKGLQNNLDIRMALQNIATAEAYLKQAKSIYFPTLSVSPGVSYSTSSLNSQQAAFLNDREWSTQYNLGLNSSWEIDVWGKLKNAEKAQYATYLQTVAAHQAVKSRIVAGIASAYFQLLALDEQYRTTQESITLQEESLETTKALKEAGQVTEVAVQQTEALTLNYKARLIDINNNIKIAENQLSYLMGEPAHAIERTQIENQFIPTDIKTGYPSALLRNRPDVLAAEYALIASFHDQEVAKLNMYPSLNISVSGGLQSMELDDFFNANSLFANVLGGLTQPIFQQRRLRTQLEVSQIAQHSALLEFRRSLLMASNEVSNALQTYNNQDGIIRLKTQEFENYTRATEYSQELLNYGLANYLEVLTAQQNALNAKLAEINAKYAKLNALVDLYSSLGGGWK